MKLLIVVDKLLTGFDAPPATYLYIDKTDAGPWPLPGDLPGQPPRRRGQAVRLHVVDYKDLFRSLESAIRDYTGGAFESYRPRGRGGAA